MIAFLKAMQKVVWVCAHFLARVGGAVIMEVSKHGFIWKVYRRSKEGGKGI